jgi:hypothetical protein
MFKKLSIIVLAVLAGVFMASHAMAQGVGLGVTAGPVDPANGFPAYYTSNGLTLMPCLDPVICAPLEGVDPLQPISFPDNFPGEFFYWMATPVFTGAGAANIKVIEFALEGAFGPEVISDEQVVFARSRFRIQDLPAGTIGQTITVTHPFGTESFTVVDDGKGLGEVNETFDWGIVDRFVGVANAPNIGPFLTANPLPGDGSIGAAGVGQPVVNGPNGNGITVVGAGLNLTTNQWDLVGQLFTPTARSAAVLNIDAVPTADPVDLFADAIDLFIVAPGATTVSVAGELALLPNVVEPLTLVQDPNQPSIFTAQIILIGGEVLPANVIFTVDGVAQAPVPLASVTPPRTGDGNGVTPGAIGLGGFPAFYMDSTGLVLTPCLDAADPNCGLDGLLPDPLSPVSPNNFPDEFIYWAALPDDATWTGTGDPASIKVIEFVLEGAFGVGPVVDGEQVTFARARFRIFDLLPEFIGDTITVTHPYGTDTFTVEDDLKGFGEVNATFDWGVVDRFVGVAKAKDIGPFLTLTDGSTNGTGAINPGPSGEATITVSGAGLDLTNSQWVLASGGGLAPGAPRALLNVAAAADAGTIDLIILAPGATTVDVAGVGTPLPNVPDPFLLTQDTVQTGLFTGQIVLGAQIPAPLAALLAAVVAGETLPTEVVFTIDRGLPETETVLPAVPLETFAPPVNPPVTPPGDGGGGAGTGGTPPPGTGNGGALVGGSNSGCFINSLLGS